MLKSNSFVHKLLQRLDRVDQETMKKTVIDLAEQNARYQELLNEIHEGVILTSRKGAVSWMNDQAATWLGVRWEGEQQINLDDAVADPQLSHFLKEELSDLNARLVEEIPVLIPKEMHLRVHLIPFETAGENHVCIVLSNRTDERGHEIDMDRLARIESLVRLAAGVAHEIGNPLNSLSIQLQLMKKDLKNLPVAKRKPFEKGLSSMQSEATRLDQIVRNFLSAARKPPLRFRLEDLNAILEEAIAFMQPELKQSKIKVEFRGDKKLSASLMDRNRLYQTFINLIKNANEAMRRGLFQRVCVSPRGEF